MSKPGFASLAFFFLLLGLLRAVTANETSQASQTADLVITGAKVYVPEADASQSPQSSAVHEALAIKGNKILAVGTVAEIDKLAGPTTQRLDAAGAAVTPGFNDSHIHIFSGSQSLQQVQLLDATSLEDIGHRIRSFATAHPQQPCIVGRGWLYGFFPDGLPTREQLDEIVPDRPAVMKCYDGHTLWLNSKALALAGITRDTPDPENGIIVRDPQTGEPTGALKEAATALADKIMPKPTPAEQAAAIRLAIQEAHRLGITSVQEAGIGLAELQVLDSLQSSGELKLRMYIALEGHPRMTDAEMDQLVELRQRFKHLSISAVKLFADGVIEAHTAALLTPYANKANRGLPEYTPDDLQRVIAGLDARGFQVMVHAIGDAGIRMTMDAMEHAARVNPLPQRGRRHRLEHIESISAEDIPRFGELGIVASMQPFHANPNSNIFNVWAVNLGPERASRAWSWKSIQDAGGRLAFGTDWPVVGLEPLAGLHTAMTRQTLDGEPAEGFIPQQRLSLRSALDAYTSGSAYAEFAEQAKGSLKPGMLADVVVWDRDIFALPVQQVQEARVRATIFDGKAVYRAR